MNSAGTSIIENAARNQNFWVQWHINLGFTRMDFYTENHLKVTYRIMPFSLIRALQIAPGNSIDWGKSLKLGSLVFKVNAIEIDGQNSFRGVQSSNHILLRKGYANLETEAHELIHVYQNNQFSGINSYFYKVSSHLKEDFGFYRIYSKIFYTDLNTIAFDQLFNMLRKESDFNNNVLENEVYYYLR